MKMTIQKRKGEIIKITIVPEGGAMGKDPVRGKRKWEP